MNNNLEGLIAVVAAVGLIAAYFLFKKKGTDWKKVVEDYINNAEFPSNSEFPTGAVFLVPGGGMVKNTQVIAENVLRYDPVCIIISTNNEIERDGITNKLILQGVDEEIIIHEPHANDTVENAVFSAAINPYKGYPAVIFKQRFHLPRCKECYSRTGFKDLTLAPVDPPGTSLNRAKDEGEKIVKNILSLETGNHRNWPGGLG